MSTMRISGIASGLDTESIVNQLISADSARLNKLLRQEQKYQWRQESYTTVNKNMANFILNTRKSLGLTQISTFGTVRQSALNSLTYVKKAASSNESALTATARADAMSGSYQVKVKELASVASLTSENLKEHLDADGKFTSDGSITIETAKGTAEIEYRSGMTIQSFASSIGGAKNSEGISLGIRASYDSDLGKLMITTKETGTEESIEIKNDGLGFFSKKAIKIENDDLENATLQFEGSSYSFAGKSQAEVLSELKGLGIKATFDGNDLVIMPGSSQDISVVDESDQEIGTMITYQSGVNATIEFNGELVEKSTNTFTIFGIEMNLKAAQAESADPVTIHVDTNVEGIYEKITEFVASYNAMIDEISGLLGEKVYRDYNPLTSEEKESMSEKEIELWEEKAKSGLLKGDENLTKILQTLRTDLYRKVEGVSGSYSVISQVGITTGNYQDGGKLVIDEDKLRDAIASDPEGVMELFFKIPDATSGEDRTKQSGLIQRVYDGMIEGMKKIVEKSGTGEEAGLYRSVQSNLLIDFVTTKGSISDIDRDLTSLGLSILREQDILARREQRYWTQFTAMEKALSEMNNQSSWLTSQLGM